VIPRVRNHRHLSTYGKALLLYPWVDIPSRRSAPA
jgi:hypothetical protein